VKTTLTMSTIRSLPALARGIAAFAARTSVLALLASTAACFDGEELTDGLRCAQASHCGGDLQCVSGYCMDPADMGCDTDPSLCGQPSSVSDSLTTSAPGDGGGGSGGDASASATSPMSTSTAGVPPACGQQYESCLESGCCEFGFCVYHVDGRATCEEQCFVGGECSSCCCQQADAGTFACADTIDCGQEAQCFGTCASAGSACSGDYDCCDGGRCLVNAGGWSSCFKPCTYPTDCVSGCCNYNSTIGVSICEAC
jgi:hypothetical protein